MKVHTYEKNKSRNAPSEKNHPIVQPCPEGVIDWPFGRLGW